jgi:hypothetical protein
MREGNIFPLSGKLFEPLENVCDNVQRGYSSILLKRLALLPCAGFAVVNLALAYPVHYYRTGFALD